MTQPKPGDQVKVEVEGEYISSADGISSVRASTGKAILIIEDSLGAKVTVIKPKVDLVPGQVWKRKGDERLFVVTKDVFSHLFHPAVYSVSEGFTESHFDPDDFEKQYDPRWERVCDCD